MNNNSTSNMSNITNEQLLLINILNTLYNDNSRQIQNLTEHNNQIINILTNILYIPNEQNNNQYINTQYINSQYNRQNNNRLNNNRQNNVRENLNRTFLNNTPYIIDNIQEYNIPRNISTSYTPRNSTSTRQSRSTDNVFSSLFRNFFDPIVIYPTPSQIEIATRRVRYCDIISPINRSCPISMDTFNDTDMVTIIRQCGHIFKTEELNTWFRSNCRCPVCRYDIRTYVSSNSTNNLNENINTESVSQNSNNSQPNISSEIDEERNNITNEYQTSLINLFQDSSNNLIFDSSDPYVILDLYNSLLNRS